MYRFDGTGYTNIASTDCRHNFSGGPAIYGNKALATGTRSLTPECAVKTETYDFQANKWTDEADYPFAV